MDDEINIFSMRDHAAMLHAAASRLAEEQPERGGDGVVHFPIAAIVNRALAVEIGMKALIAHANDLATLQDLFRVVGRGHDLEHMFRLVAPADQQLIRARIATNRPLHWDYLSTVRPEAIDDWEKEYMKLLTAGDFDSELANLGRPFEKWRYGYEQRLLICNATFLEMLADATLNAVLQFAPTDID